MSANSGMRKINRPWACLVDVLELDETEDDSRPGPIHDVIANYHYGLETMTKVAAAKLEFLRPIVSAFSPAQLERFVRGPGASQVIWWAKQADHGELPDRECVDYLVKWSTAEDRVTPEVVGGELAYFDRQVVDWGCTVTALDDDAATRSVARIEAALDLIGRRSTRARSLMSQHTGLIAARSFEGPRDRVYSASNVKAIGISLICNAGSQAVSVEEIADRLWHESIHDLIHKVQFSGKLVVDPAVAEQRIASPWSGADLTVANFLHACFVWFGLRTFWSAPTPEGASETEARRLAQVASAGFYGKSLVGQLTPEQRRMIEPEVLDAIGLLQGRVLATAA